MADSSSQQPSLTVLGGPMGGQRLVLDDAVANLLIGSDPSCDFYLPHDTVSPIHARLWVDLEGAVLHETNSPHGVYVNDTRVAGKHPLHNGDIVWLGSPGGADVVMIQCTLAEKQAAAGAPPEADAAADDAEVRDALDSLAPTLAAGPSLADLGDEPPPIPRSAPPPTRPAAPAEAVDDDSRTVAFKLPADFAAALASPHPQPAAPPPPAEPPPPPMAVGLVDDLDALLAQPDPGPPTPVIAEPEPYLAEPEAYVAEPEPVLAESEPAPIEPDPTVVMYADEVPAPIPEPAPAPPPPVDPLSDFDDMVFSVPDEPPAVPTAAAVPEPPAAPPEQETVLLPPPPRAQPPAPPTPAPVKAQAAAAAPPRPPAARPSPAAAAPAPARPATPPARPATPPAPRPSAPAAARPPRPAPRVERAPAEVPEAVEAAPSRGLPLVALAGGAMFLAAVAAGAYWYLNRVEPVQEASVPAPPPSLVATTPPVTAPVAQPSPEPVPTAEALPPVAPPEDVVTIVRSATPPPRVVPSAAPTVAATPRPTPTRRPDTVDPAAAARARVAAQVTTLLAQAHAAAAGRNYDSAASLYDEALRLDPQNAAALTGKASAASARAHARRAFVTGRTAVQTEKARGGGLAGFDSSDVKVQKAPDFQGRIEFVMTPSSVQPGDPWTLKVYVVNEGKKAIKISGLSVATVVNGNRSGTGGAPKNREIAPQQRAIVDELSGTWPAGVASWSADVKVTAGKNDTLQSQLTWK